MLKVAAKEIRRDGVARVTSGVAVAPMFAVERTGADEFMAGLLKTALSLLVNEPKAELASASVRRCNEELLSKEKSGNRAPEPGWEELRW